MRAADATMLALAAALAGALSAAPVRADGPLSGPATVIDGDTLRVGGTTVRLHGIDAPETAQTCTDARGRPYACGETATDALSRLVGASPVACTPRDRDAYGRVIATCRAGATDLNRAMVATGAARAFLRFSDDYAAAEAEARAARRGLWQGAAEAPWDFRRARWEAAASASPVPGCPIKGNISGNGRIYHTPYSRWYDRTGIDPDRGERWFCSEREALDAGWRPPRG